MGRGDFWRGFGVDSIGWVGRRGRRGQGRDEDENKDHDQQALANMAAENTTQASRAQVPQRRQRILTLLTHVGEPPEPQPDCTDVFRVTEDNPHRARPAPRFRPSSPAKEQGLRTFFTRNLRQRLNRQSEVPLPFNWQRLKGGWVIWPKA
jgi:hypothetical protein